jgi:hypothetical protein
MHGWDVTITARKSRAVGVASAPRYCNRNELSTAPGLAWRT